MTNKELRETARAMIDLAKENIIRYGELAPFVGIVAANGETEWYILTFSGPEEKIRAYRIVAAKACMLKADAVIMINDTKIKLVATDEELERYRSGDLQHDPEAGDAIVVALKCRGERKESLMYACRYAKVGREFIFDPVEEKSAQISMLPDWY